jgi:putative transcriptional regulator
MGDVKNRVRALREAMGITQAELAVRTGVSRQAINAIETGKYDPSIGLAHALSKVFGRMIEEIFIFEDGETDEAE